MATLYSMRGMEYGDLILKHSNSQYYLKQIGCRMSFVSRSRFPTASVVSVYMFSVDLFLDKSLLEGLTPGLPVMHQCE